jgi:hypothetical protein
VATKLNRLPLDNRIPLQRASVVFDACIEPFTQEIKKTLFRYRLEAIPVIVKLCVGLLVRASRFEPSFLD